MAPARELIRFPSGEGHCVGELLLPEGPPPHPLVVMAPGIGAERDFGLGPFARGFADEALATLTFDYRHFGDSPGRPRHQVIPSRQIDDYLAALRWARTRDELDSHRMALWGTSLSGGHVLEVAARRPEGVRAVVSQVPFVSGLASTFAFPVRYQLPALFLGLYDLARQALGREPATVEVIRPRGLALLPGEDAWQGYGALVPEGSDWSGRVPARAFLEVLRYRPLGAAARVAVPTLLVAGRRDAICPARATRRAAARISGARLIELPVGHFEPYFSPWLDEVLQAETEFLARHLRVS